MKDIEIVRWEDRFGEDYIRLSVEWLEKYVRVEPADEQMIYYPHESVLDRGGMIFFARSGEENVGTVTIIKQSDSVCELAKLAVMERCKGQHIGQLLMEAALAYARECGFQRVLLFTNSTLLPAISLYKKFGFVHVPMSGNEYEEADMRMELELAEA